MIHLIATPVLGQMTCTDVKQLYTDSACCGSPSGVVRPNCAHNDLEHKCLTLKDTMRTRWGRVLRAELIPDAELGSYCRVSGVLAGPASPWSAAFPTNTSFYKNRLCAHTGWASDWDDGQLRWWDVDDMKEHHCMVSYISMNGDGERALLRLGPLGGNSEGHFYESTDLYQATVRAGNGNMAWKRILNEIATIMYGEKSKYAYNYGCSGAGRGAVVSAGTDGAEWDGIMGEDFFDLGHLNTKVYRQWGAMIRGEADEGLFERNSHFATAFCDADDGIDDRTAQWECQGKYHPSVYACNTNETSLPGYPELPWWYAYQCFTDDELALLKPVYTTHTRSDGSIHMPGHQEAWMMPANFEKILKEGLGEKQAMFVRPELWYGDISSAEGLNLPSYKEEKAIQKKLAALKGKAEEANGIDPTTARKNFSSGYYDFIKWQQNYASDPENERRIYHAMRELIDVIQFPYFPSWKALKDKGSKVMLISRTGDSYSTWEPARTLWEKLWMQPWNFQSKEEMRKWLRFYPLGSQGHCGSAGTEQEKDPNLNLAALIKWVEEGVEPQPMMYNGDGSARGGPMCEFPETERIVNGSHVCQCVHPTLCVSNPFPPPPSPPPPPFPPKGDCVDTFTMKLKDSWGDGWNGIAPQQPTSTTYPSDNPTSWIVVSNGVFSEYFTNSYSGGTSNKEYTVEFCTQVATECHEFEYRGTGTWHEENSWEITHNGTTITGDGASLGSEKSPNAGSIFFDFPTGCSGNSRRKLAAKVMQEKFGAARPDPADFKYSTKPFDKAKGPDPKLGRNQPSAVHH